MSSGCHHQLQAKWSKFYERFGCDYNGERDREGTGREKLKEQEKGAFNKDEAQIRHNLLHGIIDGVIKL